MRLYGARRYAVKLCGALALLLLVCVGARAQADVRYSELPNFHQVNAQLYRGGQPKPGGLAQLARLGIKTIINLRGADEHTRAEEQEASKLGLHYYSIPLPGLHRPAAAAVAQVLGLLAEPQLQPVFVHCKRGADRTGTIIACYRILREGWTARAAIDEAERYGLSWFERGMRDYIKDFARDHATPAAQPAPAPQPTPVLPPVRGATVVRSSPLLSRPVDALACI